MNLSTTANGASPWHSVVQTNGESLESLLRCSAATPQRLPAVGLQAHTSIHSGMGHGELPASGSFKEARPDAAGKNWMGELGTAVGLCFGWDLEEAVGGPHGMIPLPFSISGLFSAPWLQKSRT